MNDKLYKVTSLSINYQQITITQIKDFLSKCIIQYLLLIF